MKKILLVENDALSQKTMKIILKDFELHCCSSAEEFYLNYSNFVSDLIIMDIALGAGKDGLQLTSEIRNIPKLCEIPILCLSAHAFKSDKQKAYAAGVDYYLSKPVANITLFDAIAKLLTNRNHFK
jgi:CheY-like chemotaxis protein